MAREEVRTDFTANAGQMLQAYQQMREAERENAAQRREAAREAREANRQQQADLREEANLQKQVATALKQLETPLDSLKQKRSEYRALLEQGAISEDQYRQLLAKTSEEHRRARENTDEHRAAVRQQQEAERRRNEELAEGQRMMRESRTPAEQYRDRIQQIERALESGTIDQETYNRQVAQARQRLDDTEKSAGPAATAIKGFVAGFMGMAGVQKLLQAVRGEMEHLKQLGEGARGETLDFAKVMQSTEDSFQGDATLSKEGLRDRMIAAGEASRTSPKVFAAAMQDAFSAKGDATNEEAVQAGIAAFRLNPGDLDSGRTLAARALDVRNATGSTDMMANLGFIQNFQQNARVTDLAKVGQNLMPGVAAMMTRGDSPEQAAEVLATLNTLAQDAEGAMTKTAGISLAEQLNAFKPLAGLGSTSDRLDHLQQNPELARKFMAGASFERAMSPFIEEMVTGSDRALAVQADKQAKIRPLDAAQGVALEQSIADKEQSFSGQLLARDQAGEVAREAHRLRNQDRAAEGQVRAELEGLFDNINMPGFDAINRRGLMMAFDARVSAGVDPAQAGIDTIAGQTTAIEAEGELSQPDKLLMEETLAVLRAQLVLQQQTAEAQQGPPAVIESPAAALSN